MIDNNSSHLIKTGEPNGHINPKIGIFIVILIILRFYFLPFIFSSQQASNDYWYLTTISSYAIIVFSIIVFRGHGLDIFQDHFSLWFIAVGCFSSIGIGGKYELIYDSCLVLLSITLSTYIIMNRKNIRIPDIKTTTVGLLWSIIAVIILAVIYSLLHRTNSDPLPQNLFSIIVNTLTSQFSLVTVIEEASFRGLLFSLMIMKGYDENSSFFIQGILFWGIHFWRINDPIMFFIIIPLGTIFITWIVKKYRMLYLAITMHTLINVFMTLGAAIIQRYFL